MEDNSWFVLFYVPVVQSGKASNGMPCLAIHSQPLSAAEWKGSVLLTVVGKVDVFHGLGAVASHAVRFS